ncbi:MAG: transposase, partial [Cyanobacteria bacterium P01_F01_bin.56]
GPKDPWYLLTNLSDVKQIMAIYRCRWGIEQLFKDCKTGGYNLEETRVNDQRFLALVLLIALAYMLATFHGQRLRQLRVDHYAGRLQEHQDKTLRQSDFGLGLYGQRWVYAMALWHYWASQLMALKPQKRLFFRRGLQALSLIQQAF